MQAAVSEGSATVQESKDMRGRGRSDDERNTKILAAHRSRNSFHLRWVFMSRGIAMNSWTWEVTENMRQKQNGSTYLIDMSYTKFCNYFIH